MDITKVPFSVGDVIAVLMPAVDARFEEDQEVGPRWMAGRLDAVDEGGVALRALDGTGIRMWVPWGHALVRDLTRDEQAEVAETVKALL